MLGMLYYFLGDFRESARLRQAALDLARGNSDAEIHQMWGAWRIHSGKAASANAR